MTLTMFVQKAQFSREFENYTILQTNRKSGNCLRCLRTTPVSVHPYPYISSFLCASASLAPRDRYNVYHNNTFSCCYNEHHLPHAQSAKCVASSYKCR